MHYSMNCALWLLNPADAPGWLALLQHETQAQALAQLPARHAGPGMRRRVKPASLRLGKRLHHTKKALTLLEREDATTTRDPREVEALLWESRRGIWDTAPMAQEAADATATPTAPTPMGEVPHQEFIMGCSAPPHNA